MKIATARRYNAQTLEVLYNEKSIGDVMEMTIEEAAQFFSAHPKIARPLSLLVDTGLGYLKLGQPSPTLSGGEAQRLKLVTQLKRGVSRAADERIRKMRKPGSTLYLLEEPTIGLHMADIELLLNVLHRLVDEGNTVIVIEHNLSVIAEADYIVDLGPEAGATGGEVVACGTPEQVAKNRVSRTAPFLRKVLNIPRVDNTAVILSGAKRTSQSKSRANELGDRSSIESPSHSFGMTRVLIAAISDISHNRGANVRVLSAQPRSDHFPDLRQRRAAMVWARLCGCICIELFSFPLAVQARICRSAAATRRRFHHRLRAVRRDRWRASRLRFLLQAGNVARAVVDLARLGRRDVESRRDARPIAVHALLRAPSQNFVAKSRRQSRRNRAARIVLRTMRELHKWRAVRADRECSLGDAIPEGTARSSSGS